MSPRRKKYKFSFAAAALKPALLFYRVSGEIYIVFIRQLRKILEWNDDAPKIETLFDAV